MVAFNDTARLVGLSLLLLLLIWSISYTFRSHNLLFKSHALHLRNAWTLSREDFVNDWLNTSAGPPPEQSSIYWLCNNTEINWRPNLILRLKNANGGIGNVRGNILDFLYLAISAGASIVLPSFATRSTTDLSLLFDGRMPFDAFFDPDHFLATMRTKCPQLIIHNPERDDELPAPIDHFRPPSMRTDQDGNQSPRGVVEQLNGWLGGHGVPEKVETVTVVTVERTLWDGPDTRSLPAAVRRDFPGALRLNSQVRRLAGIVTYNLARRYRLYLDPTHLYYPKAFYGAHLRTESDAVAAGWLDGSPHTSYDDQSTTYFEQANKHKLKVIYCASGSPEDLAKFTIDAWDRHGINVTHKIDLLEDTDLQELQNLTWDQQALVDYEILTRSSYFAGVIHSSFSSNIALKRQIFVEDEGINQEKHWYMPDDVDDTLSFQDGLSTIWGRYWMHETKIPRGMWP